MASYKRYIDLVKKEHYKRFRLPKEVKEAMNENVARTMNALLDYACKDIPPNKHLKEEDVYKGLKLLIRAIPESRSMLEEVQEWMERAVKNYNDAMKSPIIPIGRMRTIVKTKFKVKVSA